MALLSLATDLALAGTGAINGYVRDATNGEPIAYANVYVEGSEFGAATNKYGYYYIGQVPAGAHELVFSYVGYRTSRQRVTVPDRGIVTIAAELAVGAVEQKEVVISADRARFEREVEMSAVRLDTRQLMAIPRTVGEPDILRAIQFLPGVVATSDFSSRIYVRGGSPDQNLILLDDITVYNPSHLFGLYSPFISAAVADATLLAGGFPASYGGRLSSVLDIKTKEGNSKRFSGHGSLSLLAGEALVEGPIPNGSFLLAGRRTWLPDLLLNAFSGIGGGSGGTDLGYHFSDLMGKVNYDLGHDARITVSGLAAEDVLSFAGGSGESGFDAGMTWGNRGLSAQASLILTPTLYSRTIAAWSSFYSRFDVGFSATDTVKLSTDLTDFALKSDLTWYAADRHTVGFGVDLKMTATDLASMLGPSMTFGEPDTLWPLGAYVEDQWELVPERGFLRPGLRLSYYSNGGRLEVEPRFGAKYRPGSNTALSLSVGRFTQPMVTVNSTDALFSIYDMWTPVPDDRNIPSAIHYMAGVEHWLAGDVTVEGELYYKDYNNLLETRYGEYSTDPESLLVADGYSYGAELALRKNSGWATGWLGYSYMWTRRSIGEEVYHPHYDRRHNFTAVATFPNLVWGLDVSATFHLGTGLPYSGTVAYYPRYEYDPNKSGTGHSWVYIDGARDAYRYPLYHRLDLGLTKTWKKTWGEVSCFLDVTNVYDAKNVLLYYWETKDGQTPVRHEIGMLPILPSLGVKVSF
ncbi:MAG: TonB-dependent receptor [candidate division WOR-3 bacterium]|nr:TonB-dependent receptor [candidate division WOR-3 bacterium]